jgi:hypothetical protein
MVLIYLYFILAILVGMVAAVRGRSWLLWFLISLFITPVIAGLLALVLPRAHSRHRFSDDFGFMPAHHVAETPAAESTLRIIRLSSYSHRTHPYEIFVNGAFVGTVSRSRLIEFPVPSGVIVVEVRTGLVGSRPLMVEAPPGHKVEIQVSNRGGLLRAIWAATLGSGEFLELHQRPATSPSAAAA